MLFLILILLLYFFPCAKPEESNVLKEVVQNPVIFFNRNNHIFFVLSQNCTQETFQKLVKGFLELEKKSQEKFVGENYEVILHFGGGFNASFSKDESLVDFFETECMKSDNCFEGAKIKNVNQFVGETVGKNQPCPTKLIKEFILIISDTCIISHHQKQNDFEECSMEYRSISLMLPDNTDVTECSGQILKFENDATKINIVSQKNLFNLNITSNNINQYSSMDVQYQATMETSKVNLLLVLVEQWYKTYNAFNLNFQNIPLCKTGSIVGFFQFINTNHTFHRVTRVAAPMNYDYPEFVPINYKRLVGDTEDTPFQCTFIQQFLKTANSMPHNQSQYNVLVVQDLYLPCLKGFELNWNNTNRHLEILVAYDTNIIQDYSKLIQLKEDSFNHLTFYNSKITGIQSFWNDTTLCRSHATPRNASGKPQLIVATDDKVSSKPMNDDSLKWIWICGAGIVAMIFAIASFLAIRWLYFKKLTKNRMELLKKSVETVISETKISTSYNCENMLLDFRNIIINYEHERGHGNESKVYQGCFKIINAFRTLSVIQIAAKISKTSDLNEFFNELNCLFLLKNHPNIIILKGWTMISNELILITELAKEDLLEFAKSITNFDDAIHKFMLQILYQISSALRYITANKLIHRDVACRNVLLTESNIAKLADFGLCCTATKDGTFQDSMHKKFPLKWLSIEALTQCIFSEKSDVWAFGILCFEIFSSGAIPYGAMLKDAQLSFLKNGERLEKPENVKDDIYKLMLNCWREMSEDRPTFDEIHQKLGELLDYGYLPVKEDQYKSILVDSKSEWQ